MRPHVTMPTSNTVIQLLTHRSWIIPVWLVMSRVSFGSQPRAASSEQPVNSNAPAPAAGSVLRTHRRPFLFVGAIRRFVMVGSGRSKASGAGRAKPIVLLLIVELTLLPDGMPTETPCQPMVTWRRDPGRQG